MSDLRTQRINRLRADALHELLKPSNFSDDASAKTGKVTCVVRWAPWGRSDNARYSRRWLYSWHMRGGCVKLRDITASDFE